MSEGSRPRVMLLASEPWSQTAFLADALSRRGFAVAGICPRQHPLRHTSSVVRCFWYARTWPLRSILRALERFRPLMIIPGDDRVAFNLYSLHAHCRRRGDGRSQRIAELIEHSFGDPASFEAARRKSVFIRVAREIGVRIPDTLDVEAENVLATRCGEMGFPLVLKQDSTCAGAGVVAARNMDEVDAGRRRLRAKQWIGVARDLLDGLRFDTARELMRGGPAVVVQRYVDGQPANCAALCDRGRVLASVSFRTLEANPFPTGPATVFERITHAEIDQTVARIVARLGLSGFCGFDFLIDRSGRAFLLELNPRATSASSLGRGPGGDLCTALFRMLAGRPGFPSEIALPDVNSMETQGSDLVALFPTEWLRRSDSPHVRSAYHNVPWHDPKLVVYLVEYAQTVPRFRSILRLLASLFVSWREKHRG